MRVTIIAAVAENLTIGCDGKLPWNIPEDLAYFKEQTSGHAVIMGRKTFESLGCEPLAGRTNVVVATQPYAVPAGAGTAGTLEQAIEIARLVGHREAFIVGGERMYREGLAFADRMLITFVCIEPTKPSALFPSFAEVFRAGFVDATHSIWLRSPSSGLTYKRMELIRF